MTYSKSKAMVAKTTQLYPASCDTGESAPNIAPLQYPTIPTLSYLYIVAFPAAFGRRMAPPGAHGRVKPWWPKSRDSDLVL